MTKDYQFTQNWFFQTCQYWPWLFGQIGWDAKEPKSILEIGSFEGQSTCWILENLIDNEKSMVFCLDSFEGGEEHQTGEHDLENLFDRFSYNVSLTGKEDSVQIFVGDSRQSLSQLICNELMFDFIYVDGSHKAKDVLADAVMSWILLRKGGLIIFDDYLWEKFEANISSAPKIAIDSFVNCYAEEVRILRTPQSYQVCLLKK